VTHSVNFLVTVLGAMVKNSSKVGKMIHENQGSWGTELCSTWLKLHLY